jgi:signal transduction histidine kinase
MLEAMSDTTASAKPANILIVDDTPDNLDLLGGLLRQWGYKVRPVPSGRLALQAAKREPPDLVLLDVNMPEMNGYEVCEQLKADETLKAIPVIFISALAETVDKVRGFSAGGVDYVTKPFQAEEVKARVATHVELRRLRQELERRNSSLEDLVAQKMKEISEAQEREREHEQQLSQASRLSALGTLVSGIGHEINNPNNFIRLNSQNLAGFWKDIRTALDSAVEVKPGLKLRGIPYETARGMMDDLFNGITEGSRRIEKLLVTLRDFASGDEGALDQAVDLNAVVRSALVILANTVRKSTSRFLFRDATELPQVRGNYYQLEQVVINLVNNACQALTSPVKAVRVETQRESDGCVVLRVEDEGVGIPEGDLQRLMDPFFTTRRERGGSGLGLAMTSRIIQNHGGAIAFSSEVGRGTVVTVRLPAAGRTA